MKTYSVWWEEIFYGQYQAETGEEAKLIACGGDQDEADSCECMEIGD